MSLSAGSVSATLSGNFSPVGFMAFDAAMKKAKGSMDDVEKRGGKLHKTMATVGKVGAGVAAGGILAMGLAIGKSVSLAADFEEQLSKLSSVSGANAKQMLMLKKAAMEAGAATKFSALDAAKAQTELAKGGLAVADIAGGGLKAALALAAAGELDLAEAAATTVNAMKLFNIDGAESIHVADSLASAANNTTADVHDFAMALTQGGGAAKAAGLSFDETVVALEAMAQAGIKGSDAGTSLKTALAQIANPTQKQTELTEKLGLAFFDAQGSLKPLPAVAEMLKDKLGGLTRQQRLATLQTLAGTDGFRTLLSLYEQGADGVNKLAADTGKAGDAAKVAAEKQDNLRGKIENLKGSLETAGIAFGSGLLGPLSDGTESLTDSINELAASGKLEQMGKDFGEVIAAIAEDAPAAAAAIADITNAVSGLGKMHFGPSIGDNFRQFGANFLSDIADIGKGIVIFLKGWDKLQQVATLGAAPHIDTSDIERGIKRTEDLEAKWRGTKPKLKLGVTADISEAQRALQTISKGGAGITKATLKILADDTSARAKIKALEKLGISPAVAKVLADVSPALRGVKTIKDALDALHDKSVKVTANASAAAAALRNLESADLRTKVLRIVGKDISAAAKVRQIQALGIDPKTARILGEASQALGAIGAVRGQLLALPASKTVTLTTITRNVTVGAVQGAVGGPAKKKRAAGRGADGSERALVGEGRGGELVGNQADGWAWIDRPTVLDLGAGDSVIPSDPAYSGRALGLMFAAMGVPGYAKGKAPKKKTAVKPMPIPDAVKFGAVPEDALSKERDDAREAYQKRKDRVHDLDVDIREQRKKVSGAKGKAKGPARAKLHDLEADRRKYNNGEGKLQSLAEMRKRWQELQRQAVVLHRYNQEIERLNTLQETDRTQMATAAKRGDTGSYTAARTSRTGLLGKLRDIYARAVKLAKPGSNFAADLQGKLAGIEGEITDLGADEPQLTPAQQAAQDARDRLADTGMTDAERERLTGLQAQQSLAALTAGLEDDKAAAGGIEAFLTGILGAVQSDPSRGGANAVRDIADQLAQARSNVASFTSGGASANDNADLQAQLDQSREQTRIAQRTSEIDSRALSVFQGAGDIGQARIVINTLHPGDPQTLAAIADASVAGISQQASVTSPRTFLGI